MDGADRPAIPDDLVGALTEAKHIVVITGAGVSAESGIPTFRDAQTGFWANYNAEELATPEAFARQPDVVTRWYDERRAKCAACQPNAGHEALARWQQNVESQGRSFTLITQNVDRFHQTAGSNSVIELHGSLWEWRCTRTGRQREYREFPFSEYPPKSEWGGVLRPAVVWFGETLPLEAVRAADDAVSGCDFFVSVGTSAAVYPAAGYLHEARSQGAKTLEVNLEETPVSSLVDWSMRGLSGEILPRLVDALT